MIPIYEPLETSKCEKCGKIIAEPKEAKNIIKKPEKKQLLGLEGCRAVGNSKN
jgi:hypothetical protein